MNLKLLTPGFWLLTPWSQNSSFLFGRGLAILRLNPEIDILRVGDSGTPALGTLDPDILIYLQQSQRVLLTDNRKSMPEHLEAHWANGGFIWGLFWLRSKARIRELAENIILIWETTEAEEWKDRIIWIPLPVAKR